LFGLGVLATVALGILVTRKVKNKFAEGEAPQTNEGRSVPPSSAKNG
jgi:hypothetical protein